MIEINKLNFLSGGALLGERKGERHVYVPFAIL